MVRSERSVPQFSHLCTLLVGVLIGMFLAGHSPESLVMAHPQQTNSQQTSSQPTYQYVQPTMTVGTAAVGIFLAHEIAADNITVEGYDLLKLQGNTLDLLVRKGIITRDEATGIVQNSRAEKLLRMKPPATPSGGGNKK